MILTLLAGVGLAFVLVHGTIFATLRQHPCLNKLLSCLMCSGFWAGLLCGLVAGEGWQSVLYGFAVSLLSPLVNDTNDLIKALAWRLAGQQQEGDSNE